MRLSIELEAWEEDVPHLLQIEADVEWPEDADPTFDNYSVFCSRCADLSREHSWWSLWSKEQQLAEDLFCDEWSKRSREATLNRMRTLRLELESIKAQLETLACEAPQRFDGFLAVLKTVREQSEKQKKGAA